MKTENNELKKFILKGAPATILMIWLKLKVFILIIF